jgi:transcriptional regulator of acetoin/glycerol metabolism
MVKSSFLFKGTVIYDNWRNFVRNGRYDKAFIRPIIGQSWENCRKAGLNPFAAVKSCKLSHQQFDKRLQQSMRITEVYQPFMQSIYTVIANTDFVIRLTDSEGYVISVLGRPEVLERMKGLNVALGEKCSEDVIGTSAIGIALYTGKPIQVFAAEHYNYNYHDYTTSSCPIKDSDGNTVAVLCMIGNYQKANLHTLGMVIAAAQAIESRLALNESRRRLYATDKNPVTALEPEPEGMAAGAAIALNEAGPGKQVVGGIGSANTAAGEQGFTLSLEQAEKDTIERVLRLCRGNITNAAKTLGIGRNTLYRKIRQYNIECNR